MNELLKDNIFFGCVISVIGYFLGTILRKKIKVINPLLISIVFVIAFIKLFGIEYETYNNGAKYITYFLTPVTVCLAVPLYRQLSILKTHKAEVIVGIFSGVVASAGSICLMAYLFGLGHKEYVTLLPKSITTAIGIGLSNELGGIESITVASIVITGIFGNIAAELILKLFKIKEPIAKGLAIGTSSHALGTTKALEIGEIEGAMSSLSIAVAGLMTVVVATVFAGIV